MCWIAVAFRVNPDYPVIVAANREEARSRPARAPFRWDGQPTIWAGRDETAGGTWLGVNAAGLLAAVTNRSDLGSGEGLDPTRRSRGLLCVDILRSRTPRQARARFREERSARPYNPFNLLCVDPREGWVGTWRGECQELTPGIHVLSNDGGLDDDRSPLVGEVRRQVTALDFTTPDLDDVLDALTAVCARNEPPVPLCRAGGDYGTVSSSLIALDPSGRVAAYRHAPGPPSAFAFDPVAVS
jgi:uncharacterized protein with NRDE domain